MITFKEEFIKNYITKLSHKIEQELNEKLSENDFFANMVEEANEVVRQLVKI